MRHPPSRVIVRLEAEVDITDAAIWYHNQETGLGHEFLSEVDVAVTSIAENPFRYPCFRRKPEVRRLLMNRFPYRIFFIRRDDSVVIFRVLHAARHDREWKSNVPKD